MSELPVPRRMERLLESLGADTEFCDAVIGDLAEEFAIRVREDGPRAARRWYVRESLRVAPYLLRDWWRGLRGEDVRHVTKTVVLSSIALIAFERLTGLVVHGIDPGLRSLWDTLSALGEPGMVLFPVLMLLWTVADGAFGGYVAARLARRAPMSSALALGAVSLAFMVVQTAQVDGIHIVFGALNTVALVSGIVAGGMLRVGQCTPRRELLASDANDALD